MLAKNLLQSAKVGTRFSVSIAASREAWRSKLPDSAENVGDNDRGRKVDRDKPTARTGSYLVLRRQWSRVIRHSVSFHPRGDIHAAPTRVATTSAPNHSAKREIRAFASTVTP